VTALIVVLLAFAAGICALIDTVRSRSLTSAAALLLAVAVFLLALPAVP
jgi:uncharacterized membrane protein